jgi:drug/metabolite transporter (DMT)-like permease
VSWGVSDFIGGLQSRRIPVLTVMLVSQPLGLLLVLAVALAIGGDVPPSGPMAAAIGGGVAGAFALGCFFVAMAAGPMSIVAPISSLGAVVPVVVGLARGEQPATLQVAGLVVALSGIALALREVEHPHAVRIPRRSVALAVLAGLGFGAFFTGIDAAASYDPLWAAVAARSGGSGAVVLSAIAVPAAVSLRRSAVPPLLAIAVLDTLANVLFAWATREGLLSLVAVAGSLYPVATVVLARLVLRERLARTQKAGIAIALLGVALIAAG